MNVGVEQINAFATVWGDAITRAAWQGGVALLLVWFVSRCVTWLPARYKAWLWRLAFLKLVIAFVWMTPIPVPVLPATPSQKPVQVTAAPIEYTVKLNSSVALPAAPAVTQSLSARAWLLLAWTAGIMATLVSTVSQWQAARRLSRQSKPIKSGACLEILRGLAQHYGLRRLPTVCESQAISSPVLIGVFRPRIIMPSSVLKDSAEQVEMMLAHELAHVCRRDLLWNWLFIIGEILFFFHPLAWLTRKERTLCCELACDQLALKLTGRAPQAYGSMLIDVVAQAQMKAPALRLVSVSMFETTNTLKRRLKAMNIKTNYLASVAGVVLVALAASLLVPMKLVAETPDEAVLRLKAENAKLKQQLEALQQQREAARKESDALAGDQELAWKRFAEAAASKEQGQQRNEMEALARSMREMQRAWAESLKTQELLRKVQEREKTETAANTARKAEQRELLLQELKLAEQQAVDTRKRLENGKGSFDQVLAVQRELLELKLQLAELHGNRTEQRQVLEEQLKVAERHLAEEKKRVEVGTQPPGSEIPAQREVLRLKRALMALE